MHLPFFYSSSADPFSKEVILDEDTSRHIVQVLRMKAGDQLNITDGKGNIIQASILEAHKKSCKLEVIKNEYHSADQPKTIMGISLIKNSSRFEWFLEKATEIGISEIVPLICSRTEKEKFRADRLQNILVSAIQQSRQAWLPILHQPIGFELLFAQEEVVNAPNKFIAHCIDSEKTEFVKALQTTNGTRILLIGPEGDFTDSEVEFALRNKFTPVSLGKTRLRTETAAIVAATFMRSL
jgi:16S rRNA (uracil1498-N3)-methyltransferase